MCKDGSCFTDDDLDEEMPAVFLKDRPMTDADRARQRKVFEDLADKVAQDDPVLGAQLWTILRGESG